MKLTISKQIDFIPEFNGNKELQSSDQIVVTYRTPTTVIKNRCKPNVQTKAISDRAGNIDHMEFEMETDEVTLLNQLIISISGCSYDDGKEEKHIRNAKDLLDAPVVFGPLIKEIVTELNKALGEELDEKN